MVVLIQSQTLRFQIAQVALLQTLLLLVVFNCATIGLITKSPLQHICELLV